MKHKAAIEAGISQLKKEHRVDRTCLKSLAEDRINTIFGVDGLNFRKLLKFLAEYFYLLFLWKLIGKENREFSVV